ncbi:MAG: hypothetical protein ACOYN4_15630 [Bacteroidales bacterium]
MRKLILFSTVTFLILNLLFSCTAQKRLDKKCQKAQRKYEMRAYKFGCALPFVESTHDSIVITKHDTTVIFQTEYVNLFDTVRMDSTFNTPINTLETYLALSRAWVQNGLLQHTLIQKQVSIPKTIANAIQATKATKQTIIRVPYPVEKKVKEPYSKLEWFISISGVLAWVLAVVFIVLKFKKQFSFRNLLG